MQTRKFDRPEYVLCMTAHGSYYFRHIGAADMFRGQPIAEPTTWHEAKKQLFERLGIDIPGK